MERFLYSDAFSLLAVLVSIIAIVLLFLVFGRKQEHSKVHLYYISGLCAFIIIELATYICLNNDHSDEIVSYISFASTISSLFLSVVAIIYAIVSNNKGEAQYSKIDNASNRISTSVDKFTDLSSTLSSNMLSILRKLDELRDISSETRTAIANTLEGNKSFQKEESLPQGSVELKDIVDYFTSNGSYSGLLSLLACVYSKEKDKPFSLEVLFGTNGLYCYGYIVASSVLGVLSVKVDDESTLTVLNVNFDIKNNLLDGINRFINSEGIDKQDAKEKLKAVKVFFNIDD